MNPMQGHYDILTVLLSFLIAATSSYSALTLVNRIPHRARTHTTIWLAAAASVMGVGIWSMHFIGMLAYKIEPSFQYAPLMTAFSLLAAVLACYAAFYFTSAERVTILRIVCSSLLLGGGITVMHYSGMVAIEEPWTLSYNPFMAGLSVLIAVIASFAALGMLRIFRDLPHFSLWKLACALVMGIAVCGMHYTGMAAVSVSLDHTYGVQTHIEHAGSSSGFLLSAVVIGAMMIMGVSWVALVFDKRVLQRIAFHDSLTGLPNRQRFMHDFDKTLASFTEGFILFIDFDRFKTINDSLGHDAGDQFIREVAGRLTASMGPNRSIFRFGGDEFVIVSPGSRQDAEELADLLLLTVREPFHLEESEFMISASIGISLAPQHGSNRTALFRAAEMAMYTAKAAGKGRYNVYDEQTNASTQRRLELEKGLRKAMRLNEFTLHYQPKWDAEASKLIGLEALLRWEHGKLGPISPAEFIPIAEETGMIVGITRWVLKEVCRQNHAWQQEGLPKVCVSVNMSLRIFESGALEEMVRDALRVSGMDPADLELEITESIAMQDVEGTIDQLNAVKSFGIRISMDDFGTGYSSLGNLDRIPIDTLKIDQLFIRQSSVPSKQAIISTIIAMAGHLKLDVVAEGVETAEQIDFLKSRGCNVMQGYFYGKPMHPLALREWMLAS
jgi:diguanylate cyclase